MKQVTLRSSHRFWLILAAIIWSTTAVIAQKTWKGTTSSNWSTGTNWSGNTVPSALSEVVIPSAPANQPVLSTTAVVKSIEVQSGASLTITSSGKLTVNGALLDRQTTFNNNGGSVENNGLLIIGTAVTGGAAGLSNQGTFNNNTGAEIRIDNTLLAGLYNVSGTFTNAAKITIGANVGVLTTGLYNIATFNNNAGGEIKIDNCGLRGVHNFYGTFTNAAKIIIGANASVGLVGLENIATFNNNAGGEINIDRSSFSGLVNPFLGTFTNAAKLTIGANSSVGKNGLQNLSKFINTTGGEIKIDHCSEVGLLNDLGLITDGPGSFTNVASIIIGANTSVGTYGVKNSTTFINSGCSALLNVVADAIIDNTGSFDNSGTIIENASGNSSISTNSAIVQNLNGGTFSIGSGTPAITTAVSVNLAASPSTNTTNQPISVTASGCPGTVNWNPQGGSGSADGAIYTFSTPGSYTLSASCTVGSCTSPDSDPLKLTIQPSIPDGFAIVSVSMVTCQVIDPRPSKLYQLSLLPQYTGLDSSPISFSVASVMVPTTNPGPYTINMYEDSPNITLVANQSGVLVNYSYNWLEACNSGSSPNRPPTTTGIASQTIQQGQPYQLNLASYFSDPDLQPLTFSGTGLPDGLSITGSLLSGTPSTTGVNSVTITALDPGSLSVQASFTLTVTGVPLEPVAFSISGVLLVSCQVIDPRPSKLYQLSLLPQYTGLDNSPISFSVASVMVPTTNPGPYTINMYEDSPNITLVANQSGVLVTYPYNWLAACTSSSPRLAAEEVGSGLAVKVLGNPVSGDELVVEVRGAAGQPLRLSLTDGQGHSLSNKVVSEAGTVERHGLKLGAAVGGFLYLQVSTSTQQQTLKVLKLD